jgi:hypothetical protein
MIDNQDEFAKKITGYLDSGVADLRAGTVYRLQQARAKALARLSEAATEPKLAQVLAGAGGRTVGSGPRRAVWYGFGVLVIVAAVFGYQQWQLYQQTREIEELDVQILTSDLPIDAYVDRGFQAWLTSGPR